MRPSDGGAHYTGLACDCMQVSFHCLFSLTIHVHILQASFSDDATESDKAGAQSRYFGNVTSRILISLKSALFIHRWNYGLDRLYNAVRWEA